MRDGNVIRAERRGFSHRWGWPVALVAVTGTALVVALFIAPRPPALVYATTDFARLPISAATPAAPAAVSSCVSVGRINGTPKLVDQVCGSPGSTFRVIGRVGNVSQCVRDADLTYSWSTGKASGAVCLDYDWVAGQCLQITSHAVAKVNCTERGAVRPEMAVIGAVDVTYCRDSGIAHRVRQFTICTGAGNDVNNGRTSGT